MLPPAFDTRLLILVYHESSRLQYSGHERRWRKGTRVHLHSTMHIYNRAGMTIPPCMSQDREAYAQDHPPMVMPEPRLRRLFLYGMFFMFCAGRLQAEALPFPRTLMHALTCYLQSNLSSTSRPINDNASLRHTAGGPLRSLRVNLSQVVSDRRAPFNPPSSPHARVLKAINHSPHGQGHCSLGPTPAPLCSSARPQFCNAVAHLASDHVRTNHSLPNHSRRAASFQLLRVLLRGCEQPARVDL